MQIPKKKIKVCILNQGDVRIELARWALEVQKQERFEVTFDFPSDKPIAHNRNKIVRDFLEEDHDYLLMLDGDIIPPLDLLDLVQYDKDIIGGTCFAYKNGGIIPLVLYRTKLADGQMTYRIINDEDGQGVTQCDAIGTGCIFIARRVLENVKSPFVNIYKDDGLRKEGLDLAFCRKARRKGFKIYAHLDYRCSHWTDMDLKSVHEALSDGRELAPQRVEKRNQK